MIQKPRVRRTQKRRRKRRLERWHNTRLLRMYEDIFKHFDLTLKIGVPLSEIGLIYSPPPSFIRFHPPKENT